MSVNLLTAGHATTAIKLSEVNIAPGTKGLSGGAPAGPRSSNGSPSLTGMAGNAVATSEAVITSLECGTIRSLSNGMIPLRAKGGGDKAMQGMEARKASGSDQREVE